MTIVRREEKKKRISVITGFSILAILVVAFVSLAVYNYRDNSVTFCGPTQMLVHTVDYLTGKSKDVCLELETK